MRHSRITAIALALFSVTCFAQDDAELIIGFPQVLVVTNQGEFVVELDADRAPYTATRFHDLVTSGYYDKTIFHRVVAGFVIQGGGHRADMSVTPAVDKLINESGNGLSNERGTIAMARENSPHTATSQFYINVANNDRLDPSRDRWGYAVFGRVVSGMDTVDTIAALPVSNRGQFQNVPSMPVTVTSMRVLSAEEVEARAQAELEKAEAMLLEITE
ncbi:MAG: peptidylprolyl isomerase [Pseudomonadota bacterium]